MLNGNTKGNISANQLLIIEENGLVHGDIISPSIIMKNGGKINGEIIMSKFHPDAKLDI